MPSLEDFRNKLHDGDINKAFTDYELDFNSEAFDVFGKSKVSGYETEIVWKFESPNKIKMHKKTGADAEQGKKIFYLPWESKNVTHVTLDGSSPPYFVTSHFSNCRFTIKFHDDAGKKVTVMHVAGDQPQGGTVAGSKARDALESSVAVGADVKRERRLSTSFAKVGKSGKAHMEAGLKAGTSYYDSYARVFGVRNKSGSWVFYVQDINDKGQVLGFNSMK